MAGRPEIPVCFGPVPERGVRQPDRLLLDAATDDRLLAARLAHLAHHTAAPRGPGCRDALLDEEARGWAAELGLRASLGVDDPSCPARRALGPAPEMAAVRAWLATSPEPVPTRLRASHAERCGW